MSYIGRGLQSGAFRQLDDISSGFDGSDTTHTMQVNSTNVTVGDVNQILLSLGGVIQKPGTDFTVSSSTLTFTTAPASGLSFFAILLGSDNGGTVTPTDASVTNDKISSALTTIAGLTSAGAAGTATSIAGIPFYKNDTGSVYTHDVSGTDSTANYNTAYGINALDAITTGDNNTVVGSGAGGGLTTGHRNTLMGQGAGILLTEATHTVAIGNAAASGYDTETNNIAIGHVALGGSVNGGEYNIAIGNTSLDALTSADYVTAVGNNAGSAITTGGKHVLIGHNAGSGLTTSAGSCVYIGTGAGSGAGNDTERFNIGIGEDTIGAAGNTINGAEYNTAVGALNLDALTTGDSNTAVGYACGSSNTSGGANNYFGEGSGSSVTTGSNNTLIGQNAANAGTALTTGSNNIMLGNEAKVSAADGGYQFVIGRNVTSNGNSTTTIGYDTTEIATNHGSASWAAVSDERYKKEIETSTAGLSFINDLRPVTFKFKQKNELDTDLYGYDANSTDTDGYTDEVAHGFIAQEIKTAIDNHTEIKAGQEIWKESPEAKGKRQNVSHIGMIPMLVKAVQELSAKVKALEEA
jgi:hypothetical protein